MISPDLKTTKPSILCKPLKLLDRKRGRSGVQFVDVVIPELEELRVGWTGTFPVESYSFLNYQYEHGKKALFGYDVRVNLAVGRSFTGLDYLNAQKLRWVARLGRGTDYLSRTKWRFEA